LTVRKHPSSINQPRTAITERKSEIGVSSLSQDEDPVSPQPLQTRDRYGPAELIVSRMHGAL